MKIWGHFETTLRPGLTPKCYYLYEFARFESRYTVWEIKILKDSTYGVSAKMCHSINIVRGPVGLMGPSTCVVKKIMFSCCFLWMSHATLKSSHKQTTGQSFTYGIFETARHPKNANNFIPGQVEFQSRLLNAFKTACITYVTCMHISNGFVALRILPLLCSRLVSSCKLWFSSASLEHPIQNGTKPYALHDCQNKSLRK